MCEVGQCASGVREVYDSVFILNKSRQNAVVLTPKQMYTGLQTTVYEIVPMMCSFFSFLLIPLVQLKLSQIFAGCLVHSNMDINSPILNLGRW